MPSNFDQHTDRQPLLLVNSREAKYKARQRSIRSWRAPAKWASEANRACTPTERRRSSEPRHRAATPVVSERRPRYLRGQRLRSGAARYLRKVRFLGVVRILLHRSCPLRQRDDAANAAGKSALVFASGRLDGSSHALDGVPMGEATDVGAQSA